MRLTPPLRQQRDRDAISRRVGRWHHRRAVSDHTPVDEDAKNLPFAEAEPGATGWSCCSAWALKWGTEQGLSLAKALSTRHLRTGACTRRYAGLAGVECGPAGWRAAWPTSACSTRSALDGAPTAFKSQGKHSPFAGLELPGKGALHLVQATWPTRPTDHLGAPPESLLRLLACVAHICARRLHLPLSSSRTDGKRSAAARGRWS